MPTIATKVNMHARLRPADMPRHRRRVHDFEYRRFMGVFMRTDIEDWRFEEAFAAATAMREYLVQAETEPVSYPAAPFVPEFKLDSSDVTIAVHPRGPNALPAPH